MIGKVSTILYTYIKIVGRICNYILRKLNVERNLKKKKWEVYSRSFNIIFMLCRWLENNNLFVLNVIKVTKFDTNILTMKIITNLQKNYKE